jgi:hypothetical protein
VSRALARAVAASALAAFAGATWLALIYGRSPELRVDFDVTPPRTVVEGVYPAERDDTTGHTFAWSSETLTIRLPDIDRHETWMLNLRVRAPRVNTPNPTLSFYVDGRLESTWQSTTDYEDVRLTIPPRAAHRGLTASLVASSTFVPGPSDPRKLGVMLDSFVLSPQAITLPPRSAVAGVAMASAALGGAIALVGVTVGSAVGSAIVLGAAIAGLVAHGFGPYTDFASVAARAAVWIGVLTVALVRAAGAFRGQPFRNTAKFAIVFSASAMLLELLVLLHPNMPIGDALFHAHRFQDVLAGRLYFTSIAPGNYQFPYAPGLYVVAMPLAGLVRRGAADMTLLRTIVCSAEALAGLLLYGMVVRVGGDRLAGAMAVAFYHLVPLGFGVIATGNLTNAFAQSISTAALALMAATSLRLEHRWIVALFTAVVLAGFLSHTSAFAIGSVAAVLVAIVFWWRGGPALRSPAQAILLATAAAIALAIALYYMHFLETYRTELARIGTETATRAADAGGRGITERLVLVPAYLRGYFGLPVIALTGWGTAMLWQRRARDRTTLSAAGWAAACVAFLVLGIVTPVDMRYYLASIPVVALIAAIGAADLWGRRGLPRIVAGALLAWTVVIAIRTWWSTLS